MKTIQKLRSNFVFECNYTKGKIYDEVTGTAPTSIAVAKWKNTERGKSMSSTKGTVQGLMYTIAGAEITSGTLIFMFKRNSLNTGIEEYIYHQKMRYNCYMSGNYIGIYDYSAGAFRSSVLPITDRNVHVCVIRFQSGVAGGTSIYLDGVKGTDVTWTSAALAGGLCIGNGPDTALSAGCDSLYAAVSTSTTISSEDITKLSDELMNGGYTSTLSKTNFVEPVPRELDSSLVGAWDMQERGGVWSDLSSGNNNLTKVGQVGVTKGLFENCTQFDGASGYLTKAVANYRSADSLGSITAWIKLNALGVAQTIFSSSDTASATQYLSLYVSTANKITVTSVVGAVVDTVTTTNTLRAGEWYKVSLASSGTAWKLLINGVEETLSVAVGSNSGNWFADITGRDNILIGALKHTSVSNFFNGQINDVKIYSKELSTAEVLADYNKGAKRLIYRNTFEDAPVSLATSSRELSDFLISSGTWKISQDITKKKWLENVTVGGVYVNSTKAYGTWQFDFQKSSATSHLRFELMNTEKDSSGNGYRLNIAGTAIHLITITAGGTATIAYTAAGYIAVDTKYSIRITRRKTDGRFIVYVRGGAYASWTAISVVGGGGSNPVTSNTHTTSRYLAIMTATAVGNKTGNIVVKEGVCDVATFPEII